MIYMEKKDVQVSLKMKGKHNSIKTEFGKGHTPWNKGKKGLTKHTEEWKQKSILWKKGNKSRTGQEVSLEERKKRSVALKGKYVGKNHWAYGKKLTPEHIRNCLRRRGKSSLEEKFELIINKLELPYKFVGNGEFIIAGKNPDFINTNGQKIAVEVYYKRHKEQFRDGVDSWKQERQELFNQYGWQIEFFDALEVNDDIILGRLGGGHYGRFSNKW